MNKKILFVVGGIVLLIAASLWYLSSTRNTDTSSEVTTTTPREEEPEPQAAEPTKTSIPGTYVTYSEDKVEKTEGTKLLFFHAPWCPQCQSIEASIDEEGIPNGVTVFKVDYDSNQALRQKYGVTLQTTFVKIDDAGNKIESYTAYEEPHFSAVERALLK